jgi:hypothetical protein
MYTLAGIMFANRYLLDLSAAFMKLSLSLIAGVLLVLGIVVLETFRSSAVAEPVTSQEADAAVWSLRTQAFD